MSLVGNLEDLGLGEIFQIAGISRKSGVLRLRRDDVDVRIFFEAGQIRGAFEGEGGPDLGRYAVDQGLISDTALEQMLEATGVSGAALGQALVELGCVDEGGLETLLRRHLDDVITQVFAWESGEFSFDLGGVQADAGEDALLLADGINPQFVALEAARRLDEARGSADTRGDAEPSGVALEDDPFAALDAAAAAPDDPAANAAPVAPAANAAPIAPAANAAPAAPVANAAPASPVVNDAAATALEATASDDVAAPADPPGESSPVVAVDADLATLEWIKGALDPVGTRVHILQRSEQAVARIRQYLLRGEPAVALLTTATPPDPVSGAADWAAIAARLRAQVPTQLVLLLTHDANAPAGLSDDSAPDAVAVRPDPTVLSDPRAEAQRADLADRLRVALAQMQGIAPVQLSPDPWRANWESAREQLRHAASRDAVWQGLLDFASEGFERTALFTIDDEEANGVGARIRREADDDCERVAPSTALALEESAWLRKVAETRAALRAAPSGDGDQTLFGGLGAERPDEAYLAPIERCGTLVAVLYGDNAIRRGTVPDTRPLEPVLKEAGLALERLPATQ